MVDADDTEASLRIGRAVHRLISKDTSLAASLQGVASSGCALLTGCREASVTILVGSVPVTVASTSDEATQLDAAQYREGDGPCLAAAREERIVLLDDIARQADWPTFSVAAEAVGVASSLSVPLELSDPETFGGLNFYGGDPAAFTEPDLRIAQAFAGQASTVVSNALDYWGAFEQAANLTLAMEHRAEIEQAKGILMATQRCSAEEAFDLLRRASQRENRKLRDIAVEIVTRTAKGSEQ
jgi:GAF domain-containing protein